MLRMSREERPNIPPERMGRPNGNDNGASDKNGDSHGHGNSPNENGKPGGNGDPPDRRAGRPPRENGNPDGGDGGSDPDDSRDGDDSSSSTDSTPPRRRGHRKPKYVCIIRASRTTGPGRTTWTSRKRWQRWTSTAVSQSPRRNFKGTKN